MSSVGGCGRGDTPWELCWSRVSSRRAFDLNESPVCRGASGPSCDDGMTVLSVSPGRQPEPEGCHALGPPLCGLLFWVGCLCRLMESWKSVCARACARAHVQPLCPAAPSNRVSLAWSGAAVQDAALAAGVPSAVPPAAPLLPTPASGAGLRPQVDGDAFLRGPTDPAHADPGGFLSLSPASLG